ncbi:MAG TPA: cell division ATP-binding protein FtsE [Gammaproteobacteria bacterium]|nr:cell division ATP-binding protein FtsE [Gammaproteobacteria bacterium]
MIHFDHVSKRYARGRDALADLSLQIDAGEMAFLTGHSGAGKSTLLKLIALIERPTRGHVVINGQNLSSLRRRHIPHYRRQVGIIFQDHKLLTDRTVFDNVALPLIIQGLGLAEIGKRVRAALDQVGLLGREKDFPMGLSSGEQQRVGIARAVINRPPVLIADEPTGNLDPDLSRDIMNLFLRFNQVGVTVLIASHDHALIAGFGKRVLSLHQGQLAEPELHYDLPA